MKKRIFGSLAVAAVFALVWLVGNWIFDAGDDGRLTFRAIAAVGWLFCAYFLIAGLAAPLIGEPRPLAAVSDDEPSEHDFFVRFRRYFAERPDY